MKRLLLLSLLLSLSACAPLPPSPADSQARRFEAVPGKAVIYVVRTPMDSWQMGIVALDDTQQVSTFKGTYYRWEVAPGAHYVRSTGSAGAGGITLSTAPGGVYYLKHTVYGDDRNGPSNTRLVQISEQEGRALVQQSQFYGG